MNELIFTSSKLPKPNYIYENWSYFNYIQVWDSFIAQSTLEWARIFRDGTKVKFGQPSGSFVPVNRVGGFVAYWNATSKRIYSSYEINGLPNQNEILNPTWLINITYGPTTISARFIDDTNQRYLQQTSANKITIIDLSTGLEVGEIVHNANEYFCTLAWVQPGQVAGLCKTSGKVRVMEYLSNPRVLLTGRVSPFRVGAFDSTYNLFTTIGLDDKVRIYGTILIPDDLSNPVFDPVTISGLKSNRVTVRFLGADGEPMSRWWVNWELVDIGNGIIGSLDKYGTFTDENGYASTLYIGPRDGITGPCKIMARVVLG